MLSQKKEAQRKLKSGKPPAIKATDAAKAKLHVAVPRPTQKNSFDAVEKNRLKGEEVAKKKAEKLAAEEAAAKAALEAEAAAQEEQRQKPLPQSNLNSTEKINPESLQCDSGFFFKYNPQNTFN